LVRVDQPEAKYAKNGDVNLAYQVVGDGPIDILFVPDWVLGIDASWSWDDYRYVWERLASLGRLILTDARGSGASDPAPVGEPATFEHAVGDLRAVLDTVGSERAFLLGHSTAALLACLFAATYPDRTAGLVLGGASASVFDRGDGIGLPLESHDAIVDFVARGWGDPDNEMLRLLFPGEGREEVRRREARLQRMTLSPAAARRHMRMVLDMDIRAVLPAIQSPTLVLHATGDLVVPVEAGRYVADHIDGARFVEVPGDGHFLFLDEVDLYLEEIAEFITGTRPASEPDRVLVTLLFTDIVGSTEHAGQLGDRRWRELLDRHDATVRRQLERFQGKEIKTVGDGFVATFDGPARAIRCACAIRDAVRQLGLAVRAGLHTGEVERRGDDIGGIAVHVAQRVCGLARPGEVLVSRTVVDLVAGSPIRFSVGQDHELKGVSGTWRLFTVEG
jgi:class 3 adenylate cyclase/pimeloyl-ACP methyl ester carboxylesterase